MKFPKFKIRCSAIADIMGMPKSGTGLSAVAKTHCEEWVKQRLYSTRKDIKSKYLTKGNAVEYDAILYASQVLDWGIVDKNTEYRENEYFTGTCDVVKGDWVHDTKCSWDCFTFPLFSQKIPEPAYEWQVQGYMELWEKPFSSVVYCLMDMPEELLQKECYYKYGYNFTKEQYEEMKARHTYSHLPDHLRIKEYKFQHDPEKIEKIEERVWQCQQYINTLTDGLQNEQ